MDARTIDNLEATDSSPETTELFQRWRDIVKPGIYHLTGESGKIQRTKIPQKREKSNRGAITTNYARPTTRRSKTKNWSAGQRRFPATNQTIGTMDSRSILGRGPTNTGPTTTTTTTTTTRPKPTRQARTIVSNNRHTTPKPKYPWKKAKLNQRRTKTRSS